MRAVICLSIFLVLYRSTQALVIDLLGAPHPFGLMGLGIGDTDQRFYGTRMGLLPQTVSLEIYKILPYHCDGQLIDKTFLDTVSECASTCERQPRSPTPDAAAIANTNKTTLDAIAATTACTSPKNTANAAKASDLTGAANAATNAATAATNAATAAKAAANAATKVQGDVSCRSAWDAATAAAKAATDTAAAATAAATISKDTAAATAAKNAATAAKEATDAANAAKTAGLSPPNCNVFTWSEARRLCELKAGCPSLIPGASLSTVSYMRTITIK